VVNKEHVLICVMAESAAGKDRIVSEICNRNHYTQLISYTTRPRRINEGDTHIFVDESTYQQMRKNNEIAAYTYINGNHYWSTVDQLYQCDFYVIDPIGVESLKALNLPNLRIVTVYINVPEEMRKERAKLRGDNMTVYRSRCLSEREQFRNMKKNMDVEWVISNVDFAEAYSMLKWLSDVKGIWKNHMEGNTK